MARVQIRIRVPWEPELFIHFRRRPAPTGVLGLTCARLGAGQTARLFFGHRKVAEVGREGLPLLLNPKDGDEAAEIGRLLYGR